MPWISLIEFIPFKREFTAVNLEFTAVNSPMVKNNCFEALKAITCDSSNFSKPWDGLRASFGTLL